MNSDVPTISAETLKEWLVNHLQEITLIDVRESGEHHNYNIGGLLIPLPEIIARANEIPTNGKVVIYCKKGIRSAIAIQRLQQKKRYTHLYNLTGGIEKWQETFKNT